MALSVKAQFARDFINLPEATASIDAEWEEFQVSYLNNSTRLGIDIKSRQIGWSFTAAMDAVIDGILNENTPHVFVSINLDEAKEKIRYARSIINAIRPDVRPKIIQDSQTSLEFDNKSRLMSHPCKPVRGKARTRVYLDEMAHYPEGLDRQIYLAALPATTRGDGYLRIGSSPLGEKGLCWEIATQSLKSWPGFVRNFVPWWEVEALCKDIDMARQIAPEMLTEERVREFGTSALIEIFENMFLEDFQQEYECAWVDEAIAWITWEVIKRNQDMDLKWWHARNVDDARHMIKLVRQAINKEEIEPVLYGGIDVGRKRNLTEFVAVGKGKKNIYPTRFMISLDRVEFDDQQSCFSEVIKSLPFARVLVDRNGIGMQLAENLQKLGKASGVDYTNASKELWAVEARIQAEKGRTPLPLNRELAYQIHSIKKKVTAARNNVYDTERNEKHHADKFWAWATAVWAAAQGVSHLSDNQPTQKSKWTQPHDYEGEGSRWKRY